MTTKSEEEIAADVRQEAEDNKVPWDILPDWLQELWTVDEGLARKAQAQVFDRPLSGGSPNYPLHWQKKPLYHRIIAMCPYYWGHGLTAEEALKAMWKAGAEKKAVTKLFFFYSDLPFCASGKDDAAEDEADAYVDGMGSVNHIRAGRIDITKEPIKIVGSSIK